MKRKIRFGVVIGTVFLSLAFIVYGVFLVTFKNNKIIASINVVATTINSKVTIFSGFNFSFDFDKNFSLQNFEQNSQETFAENMQENSKITNINKSLNKENYLWSFVVLIENKYEYNNDNPNQNSISVSISNENQNDYDWLVLSSVSNILTHSQTQSQIGIGSTYGMVGLNNENISTICAGGAGYWIFTYQIDYQIPTSNVSLIINPTFTLTKVIDNENQQFENYVAQIGETNYSSLQSAVENAENNSIIKIIGDITLINPVIIPENKSLTILAFDEDRIITRANSLLNDMIIVNDNSSLYLGGNSTYKITIDGNKTQTVTGSIIKNKGNLYLTGKVVLTNNYAQNGGAIYNTKTVNMDSTNILLSANCANEKGNAIYNLGEINIEYAKIENNVGDADGTIYNSKISGDYKLELKNGLYKNNNSKGGLISNYNGEVEILDGVFENNSGTKATFIYNVNNLSAKIAKTTLKGGSFTGGTTGGNSTVFIHNLMAENLEGSGAQIYLSGNPVLTNAGEIKLEVEDDILSLTGQPIVPIVVDAEFDSQSNFVLEVQPSITDPIISYTYGTPATNNGEVFQLDDLSQIIVDNQSLKANGDGEGAQVGLTSYSTIAQAVAVAQADETIFITSNMSLTATIQIEKNTIIAPISKDRTITRASGFSGNMFQILSNINAYFGNDTGYKLILDGNKTSSASSSLINNSGNLYIYSDIILTDNYATNGGAIMNNEGVVIINGTGITLNSNKGDNGAVIYNLNGTVNIENCNISSNNGVNGIFFNYNTFNPANKTVNFNILGGSISENSSGTALIVREGQDYDASITISGGTFENNYGGQASLFYNFAFDRRCNLNLVGGTFIGKGNSTGVSPYFIKLKSYTSSYVKLYFSGNFVLNNVGVIFLDETDGNTYIFVNGNLTTESTIIIDSTIYSQARLMVQYLVGTPSTNGGDKFSLANEDYKFIVWDTSYLRVWLK